MIVGVPREIKQDEYRVAMTPAGVEALRRDGHEILVEHQAGSGSGIENNDYVARGAGIVDSPDEIYAKADLVVKVEGPHPTELSKLRPGQVVVAYLHLAAHQHLTEGLVRTGAVAIAYETVADKQGRLPLLTPMSEVAGKMSVQEGAKYLERPMNGRGILLGGVSGVRPAAVLILGAGVVGAHAAAIASALGARVVAMDANIDRLRHLADVMPVGVQTVFGNADAISQHVREADLVIGAVLVPGARTPRLVCREHLSTMKRNSVIVDVSVDQGGCCETTRPTTHSNPTYEVDGVVHYCVANMPGAVSRTSSFALANATLPYVRRLANLGYKHAAAVDLGLALGINIQEGKITNRAVAEAFEMEFQPADLQERK